MKPTIVALWAGLTGLAGPQSTVAQSKGSEDADSAKAAARFQLAVDLYHEGSFEGALAEFKKAYQISPSYRVLYNIAQTQYALHDFVGAYKSVIQYQSEGKDEIPADRQVQVAEMTAKLRERIAHLEITANVAGAEVRVDDVSVGTSPLLGSVPVNAGTRKISAVKAGLPVAVRTVTLAGKESVKVELHLDQALAIPAPISGKAAAGVGFPSAALSAKAPAPGRSSRVPLAVSVSTTAALAAATGVVGYLALGAQRDLRGQMSTYPNTKDQIEDGRTRSKHYAYAADSLGAATIISAAVSLYFLLSYRGDPQEQVRGKAAPPLVVVPTVGGAMLERRF